jgi:protein SCO1/2
MKTKLWLACTFIGGSVLLATEPAKPACCAPAEAKPSCCAPEKPAAASCCVEEKPAAPLSARSLYQLDVKWTNDAGAPVTLASFRGKPVVVAMFFAQCEYACPVLVQDIKRMRAALSEADREKTQVVLVSFDVERDTPAALKVYRARADLDANWALLHGGNAEVQELAMLLGVKFKKDARGQFSHSNLFTVLNAEGEIVHQHVGLNRDVSEATKAVAQLGR